MKYLMILIIPVLIGCGNTMRFSSNGVATVYVFGDSIAQGNHTTIRYSDVIAQTTFYKVVNKAVGGTTLAEQYAAVLATTFKPGDLILLTPGLNDLSIYGLNNRSYWDQYQTMLNNIYTYATSQGARVMFGTTLKNNAFSDADTQTIGNYVKQYPYLRFFKLNSKIYEYR